MEGQGGGGRKSPYPILYTAMNFLFLFFIFDFHSLNIVFSLHSLHYFHYPIY
jgi:hypothetical protein